MYDESSPTTKIELNRFESYVLANTSNQLQTVNMQEDKFLDN